MTLAKADNLHARRQALTLVPDVAVVHRLFDTIGARYADRRGGYTRILQIGTRRGDAAPVAILELVDRPEAPKEKADKGRARRPPSRRAKRRRRRGRRPLPRDAARRRRRPGRSRAPRGLQREGSLTAPLAAFRDPLALSVSRNGRAR